MTKAAKNQTKYANSLNNLLYDALVQLLSQDNIDNLIKISVENLFTLFELKNIFFVLYNAENKGLIQSQINNEAVIDFFEHQGQGVIQFEQLEAGSLAIRKEYIAMPIFLKGRIIGTLVLVKDELIRYVDPDFLLLYSQLFSSLLSNLQSQEDLSTHNKKVLEKEKLKNELLSTVSHELRTPMSNILGFSELLETQNPNEETRKQYQTEIHKSAKRLSNLISNFLDHSRVESLGTLQLNIFEKAEPDWLAHEAWNQLSSINTKHKIIWQGEKDLPEILCDNEAVTRVFINLFSNAIKYSPIDNAHPERSEITCKFELTAKAKSHELLITITDNGLGIEENEQKKIFDRFYRSEIAQKQHINGAGLGLWISQEIIKAHEGQIWCDSKINSGTSFYISFPLENINNNESN